MARYYKWNIDENIIVIIKETEEGGYLPYFNKEIGFARDVYDDYLPGFFDDKENAPEKITEITEKEAFEFVERKLGK